MNVIYLKGNAEEVIYDVDYLVPQKYQILSKFYKKSILK